ncbi:MAG: protein kinase domain-containing protein, partial [Solirubrobacteraceae bacterium]
LKQRINRVGPLDTQEALAYAIEIGRGLTVAHARTMVHRDIKPQNVLIDAEGRAKLTDFGISRQLERDGLTATGRVLGTTDYVSPEQALGHHVSGQSDLYSLGVVLYEMLTGELPYQGENQVAVAMKHVRESIPDVRRLRPEASAALAAVIERATAKELSERYADDAEMIAELEDALTLEAGRAGGVDGQATAVIDALPPHKRRRVPLSVRRPRAAYALIGAALVVIAAAIVALVLNAGKGPGSGPRHGNGGFSPIALCSHCASHYNPYGLGGITTQDDGEQFNVVDGNTATAWSTEDYYSHSLNKPGVGIYVWAAAPTRVKQLKLVTAPPGWTGQIWGTNSQPTLGSFTGWKHLTDVAAVKRSETIPLAGRRPYRYYLVWITLLPPRKDYVSINEIKLYR